MSLYFVNLGSRPAPHRVGSQTSYHSNSYAVYSYGADYATQMIPIRGHTRPQYANAYTTTSAQNSPLISVNSATDYRHPSSAGSISYSDGEPISDPDSPSTYHQRYSPNSTSRATQTDPQRREPRHGYGEEERAFIIVCAILRRMTWREIKKEFHERFPAGQKRRHQEAGLRPTYPERQRTSGALICAYYRIRKQWGIPKVRGVADEQKPEVKAVVREKVMNIEQSTNLKAFMQQYRWVSK
ncbi:hypothetical protein B0J12DRAFT_676482 [Macrophomina phaseolina]|uniref:Uncharacterized protein n=1 Tax=Macrophomina phaseolina TaxID=35725 RepID=A0ABQ8G012_9PEZI|nr:hypothetical protein B0J12DRAFT_676482 [Macrophomina phaseolina]